MIIILKNVIKIAHGNLIDTLDVQYGERVGKDGGDCAIKGLV